MDDAVRPSKETFNRILDNSYNQWHSYLEDSGTTPTLPSYCLDLKSIIGRMPSFLGYGLLSKEAKVSFAYVERESGKICFASKWTVGLGSIWRILLS